MTTVGERFAAAVRAARKDRKMSQLTLAEAINGSVDGVGAVERGVNDASLETAAAMIRVLKIDANKLFGGPDRDLTPKRVNLEAQLQRIVELVDDRGMRLLVDLAEAVLKAHPAPSKPDSAPKDSN